MEFKGFTVSTDHREGSRRKTGDTIAHTLLEGVEDRAPKISVKIAKKDDLSDGQICFVVRNEEIEEFSSDSGYTFDVPIQWRKHKGVLVPRTRYRGQDNVDVILLDKNGRFIDLQFGIITREGEFYATAQQVYQGEIGRGRGNTFAVIPTNPINAYPGSSYEAIWSKMADGLLDKAKAEGASTQLAKAKQREARWNPPGFCQNGGDRLYGAVMYYNMISGTGLILAREGEVYFVHFKNVGRSTGGVPVLEPMTKVTFSPEEKDGKKNALDVRPA